MYPRNFISSKIIRPTVLPTLPTLPTLPVLPAVLPDNVGNVGNVDNTAGNIGNVGNVNNTVGSKLNILVISCIPVLDIFVQHVHMVGKWLALWKYFKQATEVKIPLPLPTVSFFRAIFSCRAANKEVQHVIDTVNDGTLYLRGARMNTL